MAALDFPASPTLNEVYSANGRSWIWNGTTWNPYGSGIADGDRGDITVSNNGSTWTVDAGTITDKTPLTPLTGNEQVLISDSGTLKKTTAQDIADLSPSGDVVGPASATDEAVARFDLTTGKLIQNSAVTITDAGAVAGVDSVQLNTASPPTLTTEGQFAWNDAKETMAVKVNGITLDVFQHQSYHAKNSTGSTLTAGTPVMFAGTDGGSGHLLVQEWNGTGPSEYFMGLMAEDLANGDFGYVMSFGELSGIQTDGANYGETWSDGDLLYASATAGELTNVAPVAPNPHITVAAVVNAHASNGTLFIRPTLGSNLRDDEAVTLTSLTTGDILVATSGGATGVFENKAMSGDATLASTGALTIANDAVTYAKMQNVSAASKLLGRGDSGSGDVQEITLGTNLSMSGTTLNATGGSGSALQYAQLGSNVDITDNATFQNITGLSFSASANTSYRIRFHMAISTTATSTGYEVGINGPASPTGYFSIVSLWNSATAETATITNSTSYGRIGANVNSGGGTARPCEGIILFHNGANGGTVQLQGKVEDSVIGTVTFETGSFMTWEEVTT